MIDKHADEYRLYLYSHPTKHHLPTGTYPPLMVNCLKPRDTFDLAVLATIVFSLAELPRFAWDGCRGWLQLPTALLPTMFNGTSDFIAAVPAIGTWLHEWSAAVERKAPLKPAWATSRGIGQTMVAQLSKALERELAGLEGRNINFCDPFGAELQLHVPARAALSLPPTLSVLASTIRVTELERATRCTTSAGREVIVLTAAGDNPPALTQPIRVDPRRLRKHPVSRVSRMQVQNPDSETGHQHEQ